MNRRSASQVHRGGLLSVCTLLALPLFDSPVQAQADDLAQQLANPVASLISVPFQLNYDRNLGASDDGSAWRLNVQPVVPFSLNDDWNLISRTILPIVSQRDVPFRGDDAFGLGDTVQSFFFSPKTPTEGGWILGVGPALLLPTATDDALGLDEWAIGPTAVALKQQGGWTFGTLANHLESFAGSDRADVSATFIQPFVSFVTAGSTTYLVNTEATYDWNREEWSVPINFGVSQLITSGRTPVSIGANLRYWATAPDGQPSGWGIRLVYTLLFPK